MHLKNIDLKNAPQNPGIYIFKNTDHIPIYVGKAKSIKNRIKSYFQNTKQHSQKTRMMLNAAASLEYMITDTELEALILESNLIKKHHPKYNILLKDDKSYPYIRVSLEEDYPRIFITRKLGIKGSKYFGPYTDVHEIKKIIRYLNHTFGIRTCKDKTFRRTRPCLNHDIKRCSAPCTKNISKQQYQKNIDDLILFLKGKNTQLIKHLEKNMQFHSQKKEFEAAKIYRDRIDGIKKLASDQKIISAKKEDIDLIATKRLQNTLMIQLLFIRRGALISRASCPFKEDATTQNILNSFLKQYYAKHEIPSTIILPHEIEDKNLIKDWLTKEKGTSVNMIIPQKGEKYNLLKLAEKNAEQSLEEYSHQQKKNTESLNTLKNELKLEKIPVRIEAFDISNISGQHATASMVVFIDGTPKKSEYRKYKIKTVDHIDDYAMMKEVIERRYSKHNLPDLILIDGGKGHLNAAIQILEKLKKTDISILGLAKEFEEIYLPGKKIPLTLNHDSSALYLLQRIRDEAHRFAVSYHKILRSKSMTVY